MTLPLYNKVRPLHLICLVAVFLFIGTISTRAQEHFEATYEPIRFVEASGDSVYLNSVRGHSLQIWRERWLLFNASGVCYIANTQTLSIARIGNEGNGPGEYRRASSISVRSDTAFVIHDGVQASEFLLPKGEFLGRVSPVTTEYLEMKYWESDTQFYSRQLWFYSKPEGIFGLFSRNGELVQAFGEFDSMERYDGSLSLQNSMNDGFLRPTPTGDIAFLYTCKPVLHIYSRQGMLLRSYDLEMPWDDDPNGNPYGSRKTGYGTRDLFWSMQGIDDGFLISCRGLDRRANKYRSIVAIYTWDGTLSKVIHLPPTSTNYPQEHYMQGAVQVNGEIWVALVGDPVFRKLIITPRR